jgi:hypothetical protein
MSELTALLADCPDSVTATFNGASTPAIYILRTVAEDGGGELSVNVQREHLIIATDELPGLKKKSLLVVVRADGESFARSVREVRPKDDDPALSYVSMEKP